MGGPRRTYRGQETSIQDFVEVDLRETDHLEDLAVDGRLLKNNLNKCDVMAWIGLNWYGSEYKHTKGYCEYIMNRRVP
jgi:hypothetical protein